MTRLSSLRAWWLTLALACWLGIPRAQAQPTAARPTPTPTLTLTPKPVPRMQVIP